MDVWNAALYHSQQFIVSWDCRVQIRLISRAYSRYWEIYNKKLSIDSYICGILVEVTIQLYAGCKKSETILLVTPPKKSIFFCNRRAIHTNGCMYVTLYRVGPADLYSRHPVTYGYGAEELFVNKRDIASQRLYDSLPVLQDLTLLPFWIFITTLDSAYPPSSSL